MDFESEDESQPVILGTLLTPEDEDKISPKSSSDVVDMQVGNTCELPKETSIGSITSYQIACLTKLDRPIDDYIRYAVLESSVKQSIIDAMFPIGSIIHRYDDINPESFLGGKWERLPDKYLVDIPSRSVGQVIGNVNNEVIIRKTNLPPHKHNLDESLTKLSTYQASQSDPLMYEDVTNYAQYEGDDGQGYDPIDITPSSTIVRIYRRIS